MQLGAFSVSLTVKDLAASKEFYAKLGFSYKGGDENQGWLVLKNGTAVIGLFQGMFDKNILTFNPGWDSNAQHLSEFTDIRDIQRQLVAQYHSPSRAGLRVPRSSPTIQLKATAPYSHGLISDHNALFLAIGSWEEGAQSSLSK